MNKDIHKYFEKWESKKVGSKKERRWEGKKVGISMPLQPSDFLTFLTSCFLFYKRGKMRSM
jgi:hypothetical protein